MLKRARALAIFAFLLPTAGALAQSAGSAGNGGGTLICKKKKKNQTLDAFEAGPIHKLTLDLPKDPDWKKNAQTLIDRLGRLSPMRKILYSRWLATFDQESTTLGNAQFSKIPDTGFAAIPDGCKYQQGIIQYQPQFTNQSRYLINEKVWPKLPSDQKAHLAVHEFVYREALAYGHVNSISARYINNLIASKELATMSFEAWATALQQAHFEMTDVPILSVTESEFDPTRIWRPGPADKDKIKPIKLPHAVVANIGVCKREGCEKYEPMSVLETIGINDPPTPKTRIHVHVCSSVNYIKHGEYTVKPMYLKEDCSSALDLDVVGDVTRDREYAAPISYNVREQTSKLAVYGPRLGDGAFAYHLNLSYDSRLVSGAFIHLRHLESDGGSYNFSGNNGGCALIAFREHLLFDWSYCEQVPKEETLEDFRFEYDIRFGDGDWYIASSKKYRFGTGIIERRPMLYSEHSDDRKIFTFEKLTSPSASYQALEQPTGSLCKAGLTVDWARQPDIAPDQIKVENCGAKFWNLERGDNTLIAGGTLDLYPNGMPKKVKLLEPYQPNLAGSNRIIPIGSTVFFNEKGFVIRVIP